MGDFRTAVSNCSVLTNWVLGGDKRAKIFRNWVELSSDLHPMLLLTYGNGQLELVRSDASQVSLRPVLDC